MATASVSNTDKSQLGRAGSSPALSTRFGKVAEAVKALVLKTSSPSGVAGSNPALSSIGGSFNGRTRA